MSGMRAVQTSLNVTVLGDSRAFDTYYTNSRYRKRYGYDKTFPHLWRKSILSEPQTSFDVVHIPDHFRGGSVQNNIVRVALTDPAIVVVLDGIWETLINKGHYLDYARRNGLDADLSYNRASLAALFRAGELALSPASYAARQRRLISYFRRRRRQIIWMTLPVPPKDYVGSTYHAGDYRPIPDWDECLAAMNNAMTPILAGYGASTLDLTALMNEVGGPGDAFIDQWHFSETFHARIATALDAKARALLPKGPGAHHVSHRYMLGAPCAEANDADVVIYSGDPVGELAALDALPPAKILIYPDELGEIVNPRGDDRATFEKQLAQ
jgi:hypothetical protein